MLPTVDFCGLNATRLIIGANPFGGFSHQGKERNQAMREYYTVERIIETWQRAEAAGLNTMITNNETPSVLEAVEQYLKNGGKMQWIAQVNSIRQPNMLQAIDHVVKIGCKAIYFHGLRTEDLYAARDARQLEQWVKHVHAAGIPAGCAAHDPKAHGWVDSLDVVDFHCIPFFNCGSVHQGKGDTFELSDMPKAIAMIQQIRKPCIAYKIMGAGRIDARMAIQHAFENIKPIDVINVGMHRGDKDNMVEENAATVRQTLEREEEPAMAK